jgi:hypothetical protein
LDVILLFNYFKSVSAIVTHGDKWLGGGERK